MRDRDDRANSIGTIQSGLALGILSMLIIPMYAVQTAHTILLGLTLILLSNALADGRNIAEGGGVPLVTLPRLRRVHINADAMSLQIVILVGTFLLLIFDTTARVDGALGEFLTQTHWDTMVTTGTEITVQEHLAIGVNSLLQTTLFIAFGALIIALPLGVGMAIFLADYASPRIASIVKPVIEILAGIPSVVYGFVALAFLSPYVMDLGELFVERGLMADEPETFNALIGLTVVGVMITPFIASLSEDALRAVPQPLRNASYALGATKIETVRRVSIPAAISGIIASVVLAFSRAIGETMAVTLTAGTVAMFTTNPFLSQMTMTSFIANRVKGDLPIGTTGFLHLRRRIVPLHRGTRAQLRGSSDHDSTGRPTNEQGPGSRVRGDPCRGGQEHCLRTVRDVEPSDEESTIAEMGRFIQLGGLPHDRHRGGDPPRWTHPDHR